MALSHIKPSIDHIGSTSLESIAAKPIIDILVGVSSDSHLDDSIHFMTNSGYTYVERFNQAMPYRRFFAELTPRQSTKPPLVIDNTTDLLFGIEYDSVCNIHIIKKNTYHWIRHIAFRDYLLANEHARSAYENLKMEIVKLDFKDPLEYNTHKERFILEVQQEAVFLYLNNKQNP